MAGNSTCQPASRTDALVTHLSPTALSKAAQHEASISMAAALPVSVPICMAAQALPSCLPCPRQQGLPPMAAALPGPCPLPQPWGDRDAVCMSGEAVQDVQPDRRDNPPLPAPLVWGVCHCLPISQAASLPQVHSHEPSCLRPFSMLHSRDRPHTNRDCCHNTSSKMFTECHCAPATRAQCHQHWHTHQWR